MTLLTTAFSQGTHAARPAAAASNNGFYYYETDTQVLFQSTGAAWTQIAAGVAAAPLTTKGDVLGFSTVAARIPVGSNNQVLTADNTQALGVKWAAASGAITFASAEIDTSEALNNAAYSDLATVGPTFSINVGSSGNLLVGFNCQFSAATGSKMSIALSGGNTAAASDVWAWYNGAAAALIGGRTHVFTGLAAGATTVTAKYATPGGNASFLRRSVWAIAP